MVSTKHAPRYDLPNAAPPPLRLVQLFVNTTDHEHSRELLGNTRQLATWFRDHGLAAGRVTRADVAKARTLRSAIRAFLEEERTTRDLAVAARRARFTIDFDMQRLVPQSAGVDGALGTIVATVYDAIRDGSLDRLKACRNCGWLFWDESRNRSAVWCSMQLCGNRLKVRRHRARRRSDFTVF